MTNKYQKILISIALFLALYGVARMLNIVEFYTISSSAMEPNYELNKMVLGTNLIAPDYNSVVSYKSSTIPIEGRRKAEEGVFIGRVVGKGKDKLEIKDGYIYVNDRIIDDNIKLKFMYQLNRQMVKDNRKMINELNASDKIPLSQGQIVFLDDVQKENFTGKERLTKVNYPIQNIQQQPAKSMIKEGWTLINYGPIQVPEDHFFIVGDNRQNSEDSRLKGSVHKNNIVTTIID